MTLNNNFRCRRETARDSLYYYAPTTHRKGPKRAIHVAFVHPSVCLSVRPSVAYIDNNLRNQRPSVSKFRRKISHFRCDWRTSFKVKRSKVRVTRPNNDDTHCAPYLPNGKAYKLQTW